MNIKLSSKIYPIEVILNASYTFIERVYIFLDSDSKGEKITISFRPKKKIPPKKEKELEGEFMNELLYYSLRDKIGKNNKKIREYIVGRALHSALPASVKDNLLSEDSKNLDYQEDPLGIAIPWEEKYGKKKKIKSKVQQENI